MRRTASGRKSSGLRHLERRIPSIGDCRRANPPVCAGFRSAALHGRTRLLFVMHHVSSSAAVGHVYGDADRRLDDGKDKLGVHEAAAKPPGSRCLSSPTHTSEATSIVVGSSQVRNRPNIAALEDIEENGTAISCAASLLQECPAE